MSRKLAVVLPELEASLRGRILDAAQGHGLEVLFFESDAEALHHLADAEIILGGSPALTKSAPRLQWVCTPSAGVNQFTAPGVFASPEAVLTNSSGAYGVTIAEHIVMVILEMLRRQPEYADIVARRAWERELPIRSIKNARIALLGTGDIGQEAARRLRGFCPASLTGINRSGINPDGCFDRVVTRDQLDSILPDTDILVISLPGTPETARILGEKQLSLLPDGALIVNVGRGSVIHQAALEKELRRGRLKAALDVFEAEPIPPEDPLWTCPNLLITPHNAGNMTLPWTRQRITELFLEDLENYCAGRPLARRVDLKKGY